MVGRGIALQRRRRLRVAPCLSQADESEASSGGHRGRGVGMFYPVMVILTQNEASLLFGDSGSAETWQELAESHALICSLRFSYTAVGLTGIPGMRPRGGKRGQQTRGDVCGEPELLFC